jgi:hypothetical protein
MKKPVTGLTWSRLRCRTTFSFLFAIGTLALPFATAQGMMMTSPAARSRCPSHLSTGPAGSNVELAAAAAHRLLHKVYPVASPGSPVRGLFVQFLWLATQQPDLPGARTWREIATRRCGAAVANRSWVVAVVFLNSKIAVPSTGIFFIVDTKSGWQAWYRYR